MNDRNTKLNKSDAIIILGLALIIGLLASLFLGFFSMGFGYPYSYSGGGDEYSILSQAKQLTEERWLWSTDRLGAPYGQNMLDYPSILLQNTEYLLLKFWAIWFKDPVVIVNIQFFITFILCGVISYVVLRKMGIRALISACGSLLFSFSPYIYWRSIGHYCLAACYFVPLSVYLCYLASFREDVMEFSDMVKHPGRSLLLLLICLCIVNNGIGYYPFFTCFLLCVTGVSQWLDTGDIKRAVPALKLVVLLTLLLVLLLIPAFLYSAENGKNDIAARSFASIEVFSLKITQLFIPAFHHNIKVLSKLINAYNQSMPLVNENRMAYLGAVPAVGFLFQILCFFGLKFRHQTPSVVILMSRLSLASVLFMSVGGFISLFALMLKITSLRGFNRISIFLMFISITVLSTLAENLLQMKQGKRWKGLLVVCFIALTAFGVWEQSPSPQTRAAVLERNGVAWIKDEVFIRGIEASLQPGDMVFQLPYMPYPEGNDRHQLQRYRLLNGYLHSDTLKWSFGVLKGREGDRWYQEVAAMPGEQMVQTLISAGFKGIYIDRSGYTDEEFRVLHQQLKRIPGMKATTDSDGVLVFYNLYPVIEETALSGDKE